MMDINELIKQAHGNAVEKGFYHYEDCDHCRHKHKISDDPKNQAWSCRLGKAGYDYGENCEHRKIDKNIGELLMLIVSELSEALEAHRENRLTFNLTMGDKFDGYLACITSGNQNMIDESIEYFENFIKDTFEDEIADTFIRLSDFCGYLNIDIEKHIIAKMAYNKTRNHKHGKKY